MMARDWMNWPLLFRDRILKCCVRISPWILTTDPHPRPPLPTQAPSRSRVSSPSEPGKLGHWRTINGCSCRGAWSRGDYSDPTRPSALYYSICSQCSAGQLAECGAWVNDPRQSAIMMGVCNGHLQVNDIKGTCAWFERWQLLGSVLHSTSVQCDSTLNIGLGVCYH